MSKRFFIWTCVVVSLGAIAAFGVDFLRDHRLAIELYAKMVKSNPVVIDHDPIPLRSPQADPLVWMIHERDVPG